MKPISKLATVTAAGASSGRAPGSARTNDRLAAAPR
jgi:hypothetical protein